MRGFDVDWFDFVQMLSACRSTLEDAQAFLENGLDMRVTRSSYQAMWDSLDRQLGEELAADAVCALMRTTAIDRVIHLLNAHADREECSLRLNEPRMVELLFEEDGELTGLGEYFVDFIDRSTDETDEEDDEWEQPEETSSGPSEPFGIPTHVRISRIIESNTVNAPKSAAAGTGRRFERVRASRASLFRASNDWKENDLEDQMVQDWSSIDFGIDTELHLIGRQVRLTDSTEKVDLLARGLDGSLVVFELKIEPATGTNLTQLQSYMQDLALSGCEPDMIKGVLVAPGFAQKVLNAAGGDRRLWLLRYEFE